MNSPASVSYTHLAFTEVKGSGRDEVLRAESCPGNHIEGKAERLIGVHVEHIMKHFQPLVDVYKRQAHSNGRSGL